ncbi:MAG: efflux RND transporter periplasmic adaptor subunit [Myxococcota bacterium]
MSHPLRLLLSLLTLASFACAEKQVPPTEPRPIYWSQVEKGTAFDTRALPGVVRAQDTAPLSFKVPGRIASLRADVGDVVKARQVLATLERSDYLLRVQRSSAELVQAEAQLEESRLDIERHTKLLSKGAVTRAAFDRAKASFETAQGVRAAARASLALAREELADTTLIAPFAGTVTQRLADIAEQASVGQAILNLQKSSEAVEVEAFVPEGLVSKIAIGTEHDVLFPSTKEAALTGTLTRIGTEATRAAAFPVTLRIENPPAWVRAGMTTQVRVRLAGRGGGTSLRIPANAFVADADDGRAVFVYDPATKSVSRRTVVVDTVDNDGAVVSAGLQEGEIIATRGVNFLFEGQHVTLVGKGPQRFDPPVEVRAQVTENAR